MTDKRHTSVVLPSELADGLDALQSRDDRSKNYLINRAVKELLEREGVLARPKRKRPKKLNSVEQAYLLHPERFPKVEDVMTGGDPK
ncbi:CopG family ribbon-helix-helix protein [Kribbella jiaozuonensis]|uniref:Ribbon-helix-helix protein, CopG family n=1 Tax=Kribbella jiaozuonensis TaxID=2575441 RepID=A0A4U3LVD2_9ACTN|nr:ribbon-helix-helix protein, CopG family [Kribbella jiaozuonensis]TKK79204.1 ribbon-helix-helix protein, CopG family [Kribbella jiaozuonensis]TKK83274.1 ribbon-helix-helix protein, CopG family [Kribbella jiaozuonensis]